MVVVDFDADDVGAGECGGDDVFEVVEDVFAVDDAVARVDDRHCCCPVVVVAGRADYKDR